MNGKWPQARAFSSASRSSRGPWPVLAGSRAWWRLTKVQTEGQRIVAIGKELQDYDAIDTGVFLCAGSIFDSLHRAQRHGDCSLSDGVRLMAAEGNAHAIDIGEAWWQDVDTPEMLQRAEEESARLLRNGRGRLAQESIARES